MRRALLGLVTAALLWAGPVSAGDDPKDLPSISEMPVLVSPSGNKISLKEAAGGRPAAVIVTKGHWCPVCRDQMALSARQTGALKKIGGAVLGLSNESVQVNRKVMKDLKLPFSVLSDPKGEVMKAVGLFPEGWDHPLPGLIFLDQCGDIVQVIKGRRPGVSQDNLIHTTLKRLAETPTDCKNVM